MDIIKIKFLIKKKKKPHDAIHGIIIYVIIIYVKQNEPHRNLHLKINLTQFKMFTLCLTQFTNINKKKKIRRYIWKRVDRYMNSKNKYGL